MHTGGTYVGLYKNHNEYEDSQEMGEIFIVSHCIDENEIHYYEEKEPGNVIRYTATEQLEEGAYGFQPSMFGDAVLVDHTFVDGVGTITFDKDITEIVLGAINDSFGVLTSLEIPATVEAIENIGGGSNLESVTVLAKVPPTVDENLHIGNGDVTIYVPEESLSAYRNTPGWNNYIIRTV